MATHRKPVFIETLPPTPCSPEMREAMVKRAEEENLSLAAIQRSAFALFLSTFDRKTIEKDSFTIQEVASTQTA